MERKVVGITGPASGMYMPGRSRTSQTFRPMGRCSAKLNRPEIYVRPAGEKAPQDPKARRTSPPTASIHSGYESSPTEDCPRSKMAVRCPSGPGRARTGGRLGLSIHGRRSNGSPLAVRRRNNH